MDAKKLIVGSIVGGIVIFGLGYVTYVLLLADFFKDNSTGAANLMRTPPLYWAIGVGCLLEAALICYVLGSRSGVGAGAKTGAIVGLLMWGSANFFMYGTQDLANLTATIVDPLVSAVLTGIAGAVIGVVVGKMKPA